MIDDYTSEKLEPWQRFTLLDLLLLPVAFGVVCSSVFVPYAGQVFALPLEKMLALFVLAILAGCIAAGPLVFLVQLGFRGRRRGLSLGEWLWLSPLVLGLLGKGGHASIMGVYERCESPIGEAMLGALFLAAVLVASFLLLVEAVCVLAGLAVFLAGVMGKRSDVPCEWADQFGGATCFMVGVALLTYEALIGL
jgi:hypothetical protein